MVKSTEYRDETIAIGRCDQRIFREIIVSIPITPNSSRFTLTYGNLPCRLYAEVQNADYLETCRRSGVMPATLHLVYGQRLEQDMGIERSFIPTKTPIIQSSGMRYGFQGIDRIVDQTLTFPGRFANIIFEMDDTNGLGKEGFEIFRGHYLYGLTSKGKKGYRISQGFLEVNPNPINFLLSISMLDKSLADPGVRIILKASSRRIHLGVRDEMFDKIKDNINRDFFEEIVEGQDYKLLKNWVEMIKGAFE